MTCPHEGNIEYHDVLDYVVLTGGVRQRTLEVRCDDCQAIGTVTEQWSPEDAEWIYLSEEWS